MELKEFQVYIQVLGSFTITGPDGSDCTPRGRKTCAMVAMLAISPGFRRSRKWLQDRLWSDRGDLQQAASLRQSLVEFRRALGPARDLLHSDHFHVSLDPNCVRVDLATQGRSNDLLHPRQEFLEGMDVRDPVFHEWLRGQRQAFESQDKGAETSALIEVTGESREKVTTNVYLTRDRGNVGDYSDRLLDAVGQTLVETGTAKVKDLRNKASERSAQKQFPGSESGVLVQASVDCSPENTLHHVKIGTNLQEERILWASTVDTTKLKDQEAANENLQGSANQIASICINEIERQNEANTVNPDMVLCSKAIGHLYKLGGANFQVADQLFAQAYEANPKGIYLGWRAYTRTFMLAERQFSCRKTLVEEAEAYLARAFELDPYNSYVASFAAQVHNIINRSYVAAYEFAQRSVELNQSNAIGWSQLGAAKCHLGRAKSGFQDTRYSVRIAGSAPFRFQLAGMSCIAGTMAHDLDGAIQAGEIGHALAPSFGPPLRYLSVLYLNRGEENRARAIFNKLREVEPDFSFSMLKDRAYPAAGLRYSGLLKGLPSKEL